MINEDKIQKALQNFNTDFETKIKGLDFQFLILLFENFVNVFSTDKDNKELDRLDELSEKINKTFSEEQSQLFKEWNDIQDNFLSNEIEKAFIYGFCSCQQIKNETGGKDNETKQDMS